MSSNERRRVPAGWEHPRQENGNFKPLFYRFDLHKAYYDEGVEAIKKGWVPVNSTKRYPETNNWVPPNHPDALGYSLTLEEWSEEWADEELFMLAYPNEKELTHVQLYETCSEGTPVSPVFKTDAELTAWTLKEHGVIHAYPNDSNWSLELWYEFSDQLNGLYDRLVKETPWKQNTIYISGRLVLVPRLTAWYSENGKMYKYSGVKEQPLPLTDSLASLLESVKTLTGMPFNSVLLNYYRDGNDSVGWHSDNEPELEPCNCIVSISLGATRTFELRMKDYKEGVYPPTGKIKLELDHGSILVMKGMGFQKVWEHRVPKQKDVKEGRINLTFRYIY